MWELIIDHQQVTTGTLSDCMVFLTHWLADHTDLDAYATVIVAHHDMRIIVGHA